MPAARKSRHPLLTCAATLWKNGNRCRNEAAPGSVYCPAHLCLLAPLEWVTGGYASVLDPGARPVFQSAAYATLSEEVALARLQLRALLQQAAPASEIIDGIATVARVIHLQHRIEGAALRRRRARGSASRPARLRDLRRRLEDGRRSAPSLFADPHPAVLAAAHDLTAR